MRFRAVVAALVVLLGLGSLSPARAFAPNDPDFGRQWGMTRIGAPQAWDRGRGAGVVIAVVDTGADFAHPDLAAKLLPGRNWVKPGAAPQDDNSHGTHVAGIAAAVTNNGIGVVGTAPDARILPLKALDSSGTGSGSDIDGAIRFAANSGAGVINLSLGGFAQGVTGASFVDACRYAFSAGSLCVVAAGNEFITGSGFADDPVLVVSATGLNDEKPSYSSGVGAARWGIAAPGGGDTPLAGEQRIWSTVPGGYGYKSGTSMAAPHVAGAIAILEGLGMSPQQAVERLLATAKDLGPTGRDSTFGSGRLDLAAATAGLTSPSTTTTTQSSTTSTTQPPSGSDTVVRLSGADRIETAVALSSNAFLAGSTTNVVLARADTFPDALAGSPLAAARQGPMLLTGRDGLDPRARSEIDRVLGGGGTVHLLGGSAALDPRIDAELVNAGYQVRRYSGADRFETATRIADAVGAPSAVLLADGINFPDAVIAGSAAAGTGGVVVLSAGATIPPATARYLDAHRTVRRYAVGNAAVAADRSATPVVGSDASETSRRAAETFYSGPTAVALASSATFPDGLAGGAHAARVRAVLLLTPPSALPSTIADYLTANRTSIARGWLYGGPAAVSEAVRADAERAIR